MVVTDGMVEAAKGESGGGGECSGDNANSGGVRIVVVVVVRDNGCGCGVAEVDKWCDNGGSDSGGGGNGEIMVAMVEEVVWWSRPWKQHTTDFSSSNSLLLRKQCEARPQSSLSSTMVAASSDPQSPKNDPARLPLLPSERDNNGAAGPRRPKSRQVSSRYMSPSPLSSSVSLSRRSPSPLVSRNSNPATNTPVSGPNRSVSVDRRRPVKPACRCRFRGKAFSLPISKTKAAAAPRKGTPERRRTASAVENSKPGDQHLWPGRTREPNPLSRSLSLECTEEKRKVIGSGDAKRALKQSVIRESRRVSFDGRLGLDLGNAELLKGIQQYPDGKTVNESSVVCDLTGSDSDSVSSGSTNSGVQECGGVARGRNGPRGIAVSARFWQETNSRLRRLNDSGSPLSTSPAKMVVPMKFGQSKKFPSDSPLASPRAMSSPVRGGVRPASPSNAMTSMGSSLARGMQSPSRVRSSVVGNISSNFGETPSVLSFAVDVRRGKVEENRLS
ncbi:QWRF motif protein [Actinidia rufa]|uniref:QWRF motif protein n=1 Tax=Actinidia rufa TaxID=165716 RepID=A0A7J0F9U7_9ERIC|nr:QWRF motif protein [Actinidia rufa]